MFRKHRSRTWWYSLHVSACQNHVVIDLFFEQVFLEKRIFTSLALRTIFWECEQGEQIKCLARKSRYHHPKLSICSLERIFKTRINILQNKNIQFGLFDVLFGCQLIHSPKTNSKKPSPKIMDGWETNYLPLAKGLCFRGFLLFVVGKGNPFSLVTNKNTHSANG